MEYNDELLFTNATSYVYYMDDTATTFDGTAVSAFWETPWQGLDSINITKSADTLYFFASGTAGGVLQVTATFDGKTKTKNVTLTAAGKSSRPYVKHGGQTL